jgi:ribokinase
MFNLFKSHYNVIALGSTTRDVFLKADGFKTQKSSEFTTGEAICFGLGSKVEIKQIVTASGGGGANAAVTFARQGLTTASIGVIGDDFNGHVLLSELKNEGIDTQWYAIHKDDHTAYSTILVSEDGERTILSYKGEGQHFDAKKIPFEKITADWVYLDSLGGHYDVLERAVAWAVKHGVKLAANPGGKELAHGLEKLKPLWKHFAYIGMNQEEAAELTGIPYSRKEELFKAMHEIVGGIFVMSNGPDGVEVSDGTHIYQAGIPDSPVVERTGAGDAFHSGFISEYIRSNDIKKAIQYGTANASSVVTQFGAVAGILKQGDWGQWPLVDVSMK